MTNLGIFAWGNKFQKLSWVCKLINQMNNLLWFSYSCVTYKNLLEAPPKHQIFICWIYFYIANWQTMETTTLTITLDTIKIEPFLAKNLRAQNLFWCKSKILSNAWVVAWQLKVPCWKVPSIGFAQRGRHLHLQVEFCNPWWIIMACILLNLELISTISRWYLQQLLKSCTFFHKVRF